MYVLLTIKIHISIRCLKTTNIKFQSEALNHHIQFYKESGPKAWANLKPDQEHRSKTEGRGFGEDIVENI